MFPASRTSQRAFIGSRELLLVAQPTPSPKSAFLCFALVQRVDLKGQLRVEGSRSLERIAIVSKGRIPALPKCAREWQDTTVKRTLGSRLRTSHSRKGAGRRVSALTRAHCSRILPSAGRRFDGFENQRRLDRSADHVDPLTLSPSQLSASGRDQEGADLSHRPLELYKDTQEDDA